MKTTYKTVQLKDYVKTYCETYGIDYNAIDRSKYDYSGAIKAFGMFWKPIDCGGFYLISDFGLVYNFDTKKFIQPYKVGFKKGSDGKEGYYQVKLPDYDGKRKGFYIHRLVLDTFLPNPENKPQGNHLDEIHSNNCLYNLDWCTNKENANYGNRNQNISNSLKKYWSMILTPAEMENSHFI